MYDNIRDQIAQQRLDDLLRAGARERRAARRRRDLRTPDARSGDSTC
jgi:hypothetical protein